MLCFKSINFDHNRSKINVFLQKKLKFLNARIAPDSQPPAAGGLPLNPQRASETPPIANFWLRVCSSRFPVINRLAFICLKLMLALS